VLTVAIPVLDWHDRSLIVAGYSVGVNSSPLRVECIREHMRAFSEKHSIVPNLNALGG
jgi:hypothetical protein